MSDVPRPNCAAATGTYTPEAEPIIRKLDTESPESLDPYELTLPIYRERACTLSLDDFSRVVGAVLFHPDDDSQREARQAIEWGAPEDCPLRSGKWAGRL